jgi:signal transduction histidine kinase
MRALGQLLGEHRAAGAPITAYVVLEDPERASTQFDGAVYRIVQEALTNARKHAPGVAVDVHVQAGPVEGARIRIVNPLAAMGAPLPSGGNGTVGIRERAAALGGTAWIGAHEGCFIVDVTLPWQERG